MGRKKRQCIIPDRSRPGSTTTACATDSLQGGAKNIKLPKEGIITGTWNVRTLYATVKTAELINELDRYRWNVIGLCEVRWTGFGEVTTNEGHKIWFSGDNSKHQHGVAFIVHRNTISSTIDCTPISSRLMSIRIAAQPHNITIIQVYAPTTDYDDVAIEEFYESIEMAIKKTPKKDIMMIQGDWNAKVGPDAFHDWAGTQWAVLDWAKQMTEG